MGGGDHSSSYKSHQVASVTPHWLNSRIISARGMFSLVQVTHAEEKVDSNLLSDVFVKSAIWSCCSFRGLSLSVSKVSSTHGSSLCPLPPHEVQAWASDVEEAELAWTNSAQAQHSRRKGLRLLFSNLNYYWFANNNLSYYGFGHFNGTTTAVWRHPDIEFTGLESFLPSSTTSAPFKFTSVLIYIVLLRKWVQLW